jgi:hypothetical protein
MKRILLCAATVLALVSGAVAWAGPQPTDVNRIEVYRGNPPGRPYKVIGPVEVSGTPETPASMIVLMLKERAASMGADAVIDVSTGRDRIGGRERTMVCPGSSPDCAVTSPVSIYGMKASGTAIKYTDKKK